MTDSILTQLSNEVEFRPEDYLLAAAGLEIASCSPGLTTPEQQDLSRLSRLFRAKSVLAELAECNIIDMDGEAMIDVQQFDNFLDGMKLSLPETLQAVFSNNIAC